MLMITMRTVVLLLVLAAAGASAAPFADSIERPARTLDTSAFTTFEVRVSNLGDDTLRVRMARVVNGVPDTSWHTSICSMTTCYPEEVALTEPELLEPRGLTGFTVHVITGSRYGDTARLLLRIDAGEGTDSIVREISIATAAPPRRLFRVEPEATMASAVSGDTATFTIWSYNEASDTLGVAVERLDDYFPDSTWSSRLCVEDRCFDPSVDAPPSVLLDNDRATWFTLRVTGRTPGQGRVVLAFTTTRGTEPVEHRFTVDIGAASIDERRESARATVAPMPASDVLTIALGERVVDRELRLRVIDVAGRIHRDQTMRADGEGRLRLDVRELAWGHYRFVLDGDVTVSGSFVIAR